MVKISLVSNTLNHGETNPKSNLSESTCYKTTMGLSWSEDSGDISDQHSSEKRSTIAQSSESEDHLSEHLSSEHLPSEPRDILHSWSAQYSPEDENDNVPMPVVIADYNQTRLEELRVDTTLSPLSDSFNLSHSTPFINSNFTVNSHLMDSSFIFVRPEFNCIGVRDLTRSIILDNINSANGRIAEELTILGEDIEKGNIIDKHYKEIAENAMHISVREMRIPKSEFQSAFDEDIDVVIKSGNIFNAKQALSEYGCTPEQLDKAWHDAERCAPLNEKVIKFRRGLYCAKIQINLRNVYVINGFYMALRRKYMLQHESIYAFIVHWDSSALSWNEFQTSVIGAKNPADAKCDSIRKIVYEKYEEYGLPCKPDKNNNVVHASASPFQGLIERCNWLSRKMIEDEYGQILLRKGVPESIILKWSENRPVKTPKSSTNAGKVIHLQQIFDIVKGMDTVECTKSLVQLYDNELFGNEESICIPLRWCCMS